MKQDSGLPIGIFDSGIGGLTVVKQIHRVLPHEDLVYLGDTARVPYGTKSPATVIRFACEDTQFLVQQNVKAVVVACNTVSAWSLSTLEKNFPVPIFGVIIPGALAALHKTRNRRIGVIGTSATIRSEAYKQAICSRDDQAQVFVRNCPLLVPLVEEGWTDHEVTLAVLQEYLAPLLQHDIDTLVLGCTHYPLLKKTIHRVAGKNVALVDSAETCARYVKKHLSRLRLLNEQRGRLGKIQPYVTDETERFIELGKRFLSARMEPARKVELPSLDLTNKISLRRNPPANRYVSEQ